MTDSSDKDALSLDAHWRYPTDVIFGVGAIAHLAEHCTAQGMKRPLLVTDKGLARSAMAMDVMDAMAGDGLKPEIFSEIKPNPVMGNVEAGIAAFKAGKHDGVVAFGGGSALDVGKTIALGAKTRSKLELFDVKNPKFERDRKTTVAPIVAVPTTAGTGSEVGRAVALVDEKAEAKRILMHPKMLPPVVIADPALTTGLPPHLTAATGMDALAHNLEALCTDVEYHPLADGIAIEAIRLIKEWLPVAVRDGRNLTARSHVMAAATMGAVAFQKGLGGIHAMSHPVGAHLDVHHGLANAVFMPYVLAFNRPAIEERIVRLARYLDLQPSFAGFLNWLVKLREEIGIPHTADQIGLDEQHVFQLANEAAEDPCAPENPVPAGPAEFRQMYKMSLEGAL